MIQLEETDSGLRALDHANVAVTVRAPDWGGTAGGEELPRLTDAVVHGRATELRFPDAYVSITGTERGETYELGGETGPLDLPADEYLLDIGTAIKTFVRFEGTATVRKTADFETLVVTFPERRRVTLGFRSRHEHPAGTITVEPTVDGVATGLSHLHSAMKTTGPDRSFPTLRGHPPLLEIGEEMSIPDAVAEGTADVGIELVVPPELDQLFVVAPLAYYLQASVRTADCERPVLRAPSVDLTHELPPMPDLQVETGALVRHVFFLDCLVRNVGPYGTDLAESEVLDRLPLDAEQTYDATPAERLATYLDVPTATLDPHVPDWHLSTYVEPDLDRPKSLPFLLDRMSLVYLPETSELTGRELLERSLDDFYRGPEVPARQGGGTAIGRANRDDDVASVDPVKPDLQGGRIHAWLADGIPIDVFKATHSALENRLDYLGRGGGDIEVTVVLNDNDMEDEQSKAARIYRNRSADLPMNVTVNEALTRRELAAVFEADNDFVHYIGHCEESGLQCPDGYLPVADIEESNVQTFFLNACGSYHEGMKLIEKGSVVGAVTFKKVLNEQAAKVGTTFARLLVHGFSFARAMQLARRRIMTGKDYTVVGDGTHALTQSDTLIPFLFELERDDDGFDLTADAYLSRTIGDVYYITVDDDQEDPQYYLCGDSSRYDLSEPALREFFRRISDPVIYDGRFYWTNELLEELDGT
ncbi:hypothetical protein BRC81_09205 [Halobacteriales archaeon QS_1_68_20]|nr:MAG: hypothetical protein BRC81_09205 [Halobacteriales archaeon QS_1_68_20]